MSLVRIELDDFIGTITLEHERKRNALSAALVDALVAALATLKEGRARVAILRAARGAKTWSAGHDVSELPLSGRDPLGWDDPLRLLVREIENFPAPVIAMVEGGVWGGACETVMACDLVIAAPGASFAATPAKLGVPYNVSGMLTFLNAADMRIVKEMVFTAQPIAANSPLSIAVMKEQLRILAGAHPMTPQGFERVQGLRRLVYDSADYREGVTAFLERRKSRFQGR